MAAPDDLLDPHERPGPPGTRVVKPELPGSVVIRRDADELIDAVATDLFLHAGACVRQFGDFQLALSAWPDVEPLLLRLLYDPRYRDLPWRRTHLWVVEDNLAPGASFFPLIEESIVAQADIPEEQVHRPSAWYEREFKEVLGWREKGHDRLDYVMLPLLAGGTTQGAPLHAKGDPLFVVNDKRVRMTGRLLGATRFIATVALGPGMKQAIRDVPLARPSPGVLLARDVQPLGGERRWYVEEQACEPKPPPPARPAIPLE